MHLTVMHLCIDITIAVEEPSVGLAGFGGVSRLYEKLCGKLQTIFLCMCRVPGFPSLSSDEPISSWMLIKLYLGISSCTPE
jgi:hypothetical protein